MNRLRESRADVRRELLASESGARCNQVCRCALKDDPPTVVARAGTKVDDPVGVYHHGLVVFDDDDRLPELTSRSRNSSSCSNVGQVQARGGLVEDVHATLSSI
jgi:hypothetical protein